MAEAELDDWLDKQDRDRFAWNARVLFWLLAEARYYAGIAYRQLERDGWEFPFGLPWETP